MQEILGNTWAILGLSIGGVSVLTIICTVLWFVLKASFNKTIRKINIEKICEEAYKKGFEAGVNRVKEISFKHNIEPLVKSKLEEVNEYSIGVVKEEMGELKANYTKLVNILEAQAKYFDNSIGVSEEAKAELKEAIAEAKAETEKCVDVESEIIIVEPKKEEKIVEPTKKSSKVER